MDETKSTITRRSDGAYVITLQFVLQFDLIAEKAAELAAIHIIEAMTKATERRNQGFVKEPVPLSTKEQVA